MKILLIALMKTLAKTKKTHFTLDGITGCVFSRLWNTPDIFNVLVPHDVSRCFTDRGRCCHSPFFLVIGMQLVQ